MTTSRAPVVGLIGGIGSGKSALARWVAGQRNVRILDADSAGHRALQNEAVRQRLCERFGEEILDETGVVSRPQLAAIVFGITPEHRQHRETLEQIVHPVIREDIRAQLQQAAADPAVELILLDAALLLEAGWNELCDAVVFVDTPRTIRQQRVQSNRNWSEDELQRREANQRSVTEKRAAADAVVDNSRSIEVAGGQFLEWFERQFRAPDCGRNQAGLAPA
ncbi:Dephospho-CoA kinase [Maioricimonas rarisocia]|uniref:Dephospho-CoA kinase n=1 Tax=Maioricimonas rarisocia TaxID=2528026 RepID=A0A517Z3Q1_9PLAN|nr:dephospho-CoA kinase [Maioricimonas rarisocia]QDU37124.1 Dephospho-CoA kinase [Maioricimonas rarisocia]